MAYTLLDRRDPAFGYTMEELFKIINREEEKVLEEIKKDKSNFGRIQMWVKDINMNLITDAQIERIRKAYRDAGWNERTVVERHEETAQNSLYICLYF